MSLTRHFCCCLPVRLGVFVLSLLSLVGGGIYAAAVWYAYYHSTKDDTLSLTTSQKIAFIVTGVVYSIGAIAALFGFIGAIGRKRGLVATYSTFMWFHLAAQVAIGAFFIYAIFQNSDELVNQCKQSVNQVNNANQATNSNNVNVNPDDACRVFTKWGRVGAIISLVIILLIELYCCFIVSRYVAQLTDEQSFRAVNRSSHLEANTGRKSGYYPHEPINAGTELLSKEGHHEYPYAQNQHSFGHKG
ncbi:tetraspanin family protein [Ceratobasidium sp. AG-Ba]|nr:tetraspanin family protein [Ceratobasidium sp. AG-Ba]